jgi:hypothetical protein
MNTPVCGLRVASIIAGLGSLAHVVRLVLGFQILIGSHAIPVWLSAIGFVVLALLSGWLWMLSAAAKPAAPAAPPAA